MNHLYFALFFAATQFFGSTESSLSLQKENSVLKDTIPFVCGQADGYEEFLKQNPDVLKRQNQWEVEQKKRATSRQSTARRGTAYEIPVVVHIIHNNGSENISDAEVAKGIQYLNDGMAATGPFAGVGGIDTEMTFRLAERDPDNNVTTGINRVVSPLTEMLKSEDLEVKNLIRWDPTCYVNFWLVREICKLGGDCSVAGYAYFPSVHGMDVDGVVMEARHFAGSPESAIVQIHEIGHYLGLYHTFQDGCKNDDCLVDGDRVCDTPPDQSTARVNCVDGANSCSTDVNPSDPNNPFTSDENDQMENFMDYASCSVLFTVGQKNRMVDALENVRSSLIDTDRCPVFCSSPVTANFSASATDILAGETVTFTDLSAGAVNSIWTIDDVPFLGNQFMFNTVGSFTVKLQIIGSDPACRDNFSLSITVKCPVEADFATSATQVALNETVNFTNSSINATSYEWTVNNSIQSSAANFNISWTAPGIYTVCLSAENTICQSKKCQRILVTSDSGGNPPCTGPDCEDCNNGIDDNDDGLVDFYDPDCPCITDSSCGAPFYNPCLQDCMQPDPIDTMLFDVDYTGYLTNEYGFMSAADYDGDCEPEICLLMDNNNIGILGRNGYEYSLPDQGVMFAGMVSGDVDNDGAAEIFVIASSTLMGPMSIWRIDYNPILDRLEKTWESSRTFDLEGNRLFYTRIVPALADFNHDGRQEVYVGNQIFDSETGQFIVSPSQGFNTGAVKFRRTVRGIYTTSVAMDLLPDAACPDCSGLELAAGNQVFSVEINSTTNPALNSMKVARELPGFSDGATALVDFDLDGDIDIVVANFEGVNHPLNIYIWDAQTPNQIGQSIELEFYEPQGVATPAIGDLDGDGRPEIVINSGRITSLEDFENGGGVNWGADPNQTILGSYDLTDHQIGINLFDFNLDGKQEIVLIDQFGLYVFDQKMNVLGIDEEIVAITQILETPIIIDWDNDQEAEILTIGCNGGVSDDPSGCNAQLVVINSANFPWANTRKIQNQFAYFNTNINDDGTLPIQQQSPHLLNDPALNSFNQQYALPKPEDCAEENCINGIDDDNDGLVDFFDDDCPCITDTNCGAPFYSPCQEICSDSEPIDTMLLSIDYTGIETRGTGVINAADYDGDCEPEVCVRMPNRTIGIVGQSGVESTFTTNADHGLYAIASADVDNDGAAEIFAIVENYRTDLFFIWRLDYNSALNRLEKTWESSQAIDLEGYDINLNRMVPSIADFNYDGRPEVYLGNQIYDSQTGQFLGSPGAGFNTGCAEAPDGDKEGIYTTSIAVDALPDNACPDCTGLELVAGNQVFSVAINSTTNPTTNSIKVAVELPGFHDGVTAVVDFDLDGDLDIVVANLKGIVEVGKLYIWDAQTPTQIGQAIEEDFSDFLGMSIPAIGDLDGDGSPEIVINSSDLFSFDDYQSGGGTTWGSDPSKVILGKRFLRDHQVGMTLFDFNLDGKQEIVLRNQFGFFILDEKLKTLGVEKAFQGATNLPETPLIIDWDDDGEAEIITFGCKGSIQGPTFCQAEFIVINSASFKWANTRKIQNQYAYFNTNINDDGTVPTQQQSPHLLNNPALNSFNQQYAMPPPLGAEASAEIEDSRCGANGIEIDFKICNDGEESLPANTPVAIYDGNPTLINATLLLTFELFDVLFPGECTSLTDTVFASQDSVFVVVNDDGTLPRPFNLTDQFPPTNIRECDYSNNISGIEVPMGNSPLLDLGPDILICDNGVFPLDAGAGFATYFWSDESLERTLTVYEPGKYWVDVTDICGAIQSDTIVIEIDPLTEVKLGTDLTVCIGDTIQFDAGVFDNYKWLPKSAFDCDTCQVFNLKISQDTQVIVQVQSDLGCISLDTIDVFVVAAPIGFDSIFICRGDTISVNGTAVFSDTLLSQNINSLNGCDSILNTKVIVNDSIFIKEKIEICAGDTLIIFGNIVTGNDTLLQVLNRLNGCDSTRRVEVKVKPQLFNSDELQFCEGDTAMIFGTVVTESDTLSQIFTSSVGCDSTSEIRIVFTNSINTDDELDLCAGDTVIVFGNEITSDSILFETYNSANGCDSIHEVRVKFRPTLSGREQLEFCEGDTVMIFGYEVTQNDTLIEILTAVNGCDSTATVEVFFNTKTNSDETLEFCEGDTAVIFGVQVLKDSIISQTLFGFNGCDSTHSIEVKFNQKIQTEDSLQICSGDTVFVFGNPIMSDSIVSEIYTSSNRCDSISRIKIFLRPTIQTDDEMQFCAGDTAMIFGIAITQNDTLSEVFTSAIGCDSTSEIRVVFTNSINTDDDLDLCAGDTVMVFGNEITSDSILFETYNSTAGCDSTHEVRVKFRPAISGGEMLVFCEGDTAMIFGNQLTKSDTISEILTAVDGCDSLTTIEVIFNQKSNSNEVLEFCEGDTARIFGLEILSDSIVSQTLPNINGCDSTHSIELIFKQKFETFEQLEFCVGDTAFLFGNVLTQDDTVSQILTSVIGCDSTHNIDVVFLAEAERIIFDSLCAGEFLLFFNDTISETGTYFQTIESIAGGCDTNYILTAEFFDDPIVELVSDTLIEIGTNFEIPLIISDSTLQVTWQPNSNLSCENCSNPIVNITEDMSFEATITNAQGCSVIARINIKVVGETGVYIPTGFSPNNDFNNDVFTVYFKNPKQIDQLQIYDRWGGLVFEINEFMSNDPAIGWDGTSKDLPVNSGVFIYKFLIRNEVGEQEVIAGDVTVLR